MTYRIVLDGVEIDTGLTLDCFVTKYLGGKTLEEAQRYALFEE